MWCIPYIILTVPLEERRLHPHSTNKAGEAQREVKWLAQGHTGSTWWSRSPSQAGWNSFFQSPHSFIAPSLSLEPPSPSLMVPHLCCQLDVIVLMYRGLKWDSERASSCPRSNSQLWCPLKSAQFQSLCLRPAQANRALCRDGNVCICTVRYMWLLSSWNITRELYFKVYLPLTNFHFHLHYHLGLVAVVLDSATLTPNCSKQISPQHSHL